MARAARRVRRWRRRDPSRCSLLRRFVRTCARRMARELRPAPRDGRRADAMTVMGASKPRRPRPHDAPRCEHGPQLVSLVGEQDGPTVAFTPPLGGIRDLPYRRRLRPLRAGWGSTSSRALDSRRRTTSARVIVIPGCSARSRAAYASRRSRIVVGSRNAVCCVASCTMSSHVTRVGYIVNHSMPIG